jgi:hypothetical protein
MSSAFGVLMGLSEYGRLTGVSPVLTQRSIDRRTQSLHRTEDQGHGLRILESESLERIRNR